MGAFDKYFGQLVVIKWESDFLIANSLDPLDPDNWSATGYLAEWRNPGSSIGSAYGLVFESTSFEYRQGSYGIPCFEEKDVACLTTSSLQSTNALTQESLDFMARFNLIFPYLYAPHHNLSTIKIPDNNSFNCCGKANSSCNPIKKTCNTCANSNLLSAICRKNGSNIDLNGSCSQWEP